MNLISRVLSRLAQTSLLLASLIGGAGASAQTVTYFHNDISGTPVLATDANGNVVWKANYRPYGERMNNPSAEAGNAIGFAGKPFDPGTGLSYMGARYYNPMLGRFMGVDPAPGNVGDLHSFNRYAYANNNPYKFVDPDGRSPALAIEVGVPLLVGGAIYYATQTPERQQAMRASLGQFFDNLTRSESSNGQGQKQEAATGANSGKDRESTLRPGPNAGDSIPARGPGRDFTPEERDKVNDIGNDSGCHTCGSKDPGTKSGNFVPDHQPPNRLNPDGGPQRLYPQCLGCSRTQGGQVRGAGSGG